MKPFMALLPFVVFGRVERLGAYDAALASLPSHDPEGDCGVLIVSESNCKGEVESQPIPSFPSPKGGGIQK